MFDRSCFFLLQLKWAKNKSFDYKELVGWECEFLFCTGSRITSVEYLERLDHKLRYLKLMKQFSVFISHVIKTKNHNRLINKIKNLVSSVFNSRAIRWSMSPTFIEICMETPCWCPSGWAPPWRPETNRNISHWVLLQERKFISRGTQKH